MTDQERAERKAARQARRAALKHQIEDTVSQWREDHSIDSEEGAELRKELLDVLWAAVPILVDGEIGPDDAPAIQRLFVEIEELRDTFIEHMKD